MSSLDCLKFQCLVMSRVMAGSLTVTLSHIAKCLFCAEILAFLADSRLRSQGPNTRCFYLLQWYAPDEVLPC